ncbi:DUF4262 domain-containing protein [Streptomyces sp. TLI_185]|uniref:DUF4262 domain-containing protein n=1 Tax=Streptomyces sp. TLI_185 TaxID=2485151 RepID=UPI0021A65939|nr:DUF4262 domain-containing protein [Streptomyces sp. TLI_185]
MFRDGFECRCILCHDYGDRAEADRLEETVIDNVRRHGWHVLMVPEDEIGPGFAHTIGLSHTHGAAEMSIFGPDIHEMHRMLNVLGDRVAAGDALEDGPELNGVREGRPVKLRSVDMRW